MNCFPQSNGQELCCCPGRWFVIEEDEYPLSNRGEPLRKSTVIKRCFFLNPSTRTRTLKEEVRKFACKANPADEYPLSNRGEPLRKKHRNNAVLFLNPSTRTKTPEEEVRKFALANLMSKDRKKSKERQISIVKYLLKEYSVFEWSPKPSITAHKAPFLRNSDFGHLRLCKPLCPHARKSVFCTVLIGLVIR